MGENVIPSPYTTTGNVHFMLLKQTSKEEPSDKITANDVPDIEAQPSTNVEAKLDSKPLPKASKVSEFYIGDLLRTSDKDQLDTSSTIHNQFPLHQNTIRELLVLKKPHYIPSVDFKEVSITHAVSASNDQGYAADESAPYNHGRVPPGPPEYRNPDSYRQEDSYEDSPAYSRSYPSSSKSYAAEHDSNTNSESSSVVVFDNRKLPQQGYSRGRGQGSRKKSKARPSHSPDSYSEQEPPYQGSPERDQYYDGPHSQAPSRYHSNTEAPVNRKPEQHYSEQPEPEHYERGNYRKSKAPPAESYPMTDTANLLKGRDNTVVLLKNTAQMRDLEDNQMVIIMKSLMLQSHQHHTEEKIGTIKLPIIILLDPTMRDNNIKKVLPWHLLDQQTKGNTMAILHKSGPRDVSYKRNSQAPRSSRGKRPEYAYESTPYSHGQSSEGHPRTQRSSSRLARSSPQRYRPSTGEGRSPSPVPAVELQELARKETGPQQLQLEPSVSYSEK
ncbi:uncharacterized protein CEXT_204271 [Caerostris extrusa]|uniref:Uncharacterized protein n=1 Tax=Caerostris extrusa TaxID=172846 RepID=A0AAV4XJW9_CAEEX|nr:uncharacterized protein CEXT_204271 [Caerostris extrusa]